MSAKHAVVIGGTRGIGEGVVQLLEEKGWHVSATGVGHDEVETFKTRHPSADAYQLDVTSNDQVTDLFSSFDRLDGLVNCAGIVCRGKEYEIESFEQVINVNLTGTMRCCLAAQALLAKSEGAIVNTASMLSYFGGPLVPAYTASKGGVAQLTKSLAGQWASENIRVNAVAPGWIETELTDTLRSDSNRNNAVLSRTPLNRWGIATEVGTLVAFLLSNEANFITGSVYPVDGGYSAM